MVAFNRALLGFQAPKAVCGALKRRYGSGAKDLRTRGFRPFCQSLTKVCGLDIAIGGMLNSPDSARHIAQWPKLSNLLWRQYRHLHPDSRHVPR
jgi:hypothetical protein